MKKIIITLILVTPLLTKAQTSTIQGSWTLDIDETINVLSQEDKLRYDTLADNIKTRAKNAMDGRVFVFNENGAASVSYSVRGQARSATGTWAYEEATKTLEIVIDEVHYVYTCQQPSVNSLILVAAVKDGFFNSLYFNRTNP
jgi:hypothetical protein